MNPNRRRNILIGAIAFALLAHVSVLTYLHLIPITLTVGSGNWAPDFRPDSNVGTDDTERDHQLAQVFKTLTRQASTTNVVQAQTEAASQQLEQNLQKEFIQDLSRLDPTDLEVVFTTDASASKARSEASEKLLGEIELQMQAIQYDPTGLQLGGKEGSSSAEANLENRSGICQQVADAALKGAATEGALQEQLVTQLEAGSSVPKEGSGQASIASSNDFILSVDYAPSRSGQGYLFRITLTPKPNVVFRRIAHNIFFLIDRSSSIDKSRYEISKAAVLQALKLLQKGDRFNVLVFDDKVVALAPDALPFTPENIARAETFLAAQPHGGMFAGTDLYTSLGNIIPEAVLPQEVYSAILMSDGDTQLAREARRLTIAHWTAHNQGKVSLFSLAAGKHNNLPLLDLLTVCNRGFGAHCAEVEKLPQALTDLVDSIRSPIGKDIVVTPVTSREDTTIILYPPSHRLPHLYRETPYVFYGMTSDLEGFYLFLQGKYYDRHLDIKHPITFSGARQVSPDALAREIILQQGYELYEAYLREGKPEALVQIQRLLRPYGIKTAFD